MTGTDELWHGERILSRDDFVKMENKRNYSLLFTDFLSDIDKFSAAAL